MTTNTLKLQVRALFLEERLTRPEIYERLSHRLSQASVTEYIKEAIQYANETGIEIPRSGKRIGGYTPRTARKALSPVHRAVGVHLLRHRVTLGMERGEFADKHDFANRVWVGEMEDGLFDFSLSQLLKIAEITNMTLEELTKPLTCKVQVQSST